MLTLVPDSLWTDYQPMVVLGLPIGRRICVARGAAGQLVVFSPIQATDRAIAELRALGEIAAFVLPNRMHDRFYDGYFDAFKRSRFLAFADAIADHRSWPLEALAPDLPELRGFTYAVLDGMPRLQEHVFLHVASRTLIVADSLFNLLLPDSRWTRLLMRAAGMGGKPRPSRFFRSLIRSREALGRSLREIAAWDFDRIVSGHGEIVPRDGQQVFREGFAEYLSAGSA